MQFAPVFRAATVLFFSASASVAVAEPATSDGADALTGVFETYLGAVDGVVSVLPQGDSYSLTLDFNPLIALIPDAGATARITPFMFDLTDQGDGTWRMMQDQPISMTVMVPDQLDLSVTVGRFTSQGVFDESLSAFSSSGSELTDIAVTQAITTPLEGRTRVTYSVESGRYESRATASGLGGVDVTSSYGLTGVSEIFTLPAMDGSSTPIGMSMTAEAYTASGKMTGLRPDALYKLVAFVVSHPSQAALIADQVALKSIVKDGLPLFSNLKSTGTVTNITVGSPVGAFGLAEAGIEVEANGIVADGMVREAFSLSGLTLPEGLVPDWALALVPDSLVLDFQVARFDLAAPAAMLLDAIDLAAAEPVDPAMAATLLAALLPEGAVDITMAPGHVTSGIYDLRFEGAMSAGPAAPPTGKATITALGIAGVRAALTAAPAEIGMQIAPLLAMAQGMAKPGPDGSLIWEIDATRPGTLLINGVDMMTMGAQ